MCLNPKVAPVGLVAESEDSAEGYFTQGRAIIGLRKNALSESTDLEYVMCNFDNLGLGQIEPILGGWGEPIKRRNLSFIRGSLGGGGE